MATQQNFNAICDEYLASSTREAELKDALKDVSGRKRELEDIIKRVMEEKNLIEVPFPSFTVKMKESVKSKAPQKSELTAKLSEKLGLQPSVIENMMKELKTESRVRSVKAVRKV
jgi:hypothetical protein